MPSNATLDSSAAAREPELLAVVDVGSARIACAVADVSGSRPEVLAVETAASYGIRGGEIIDVERAAESIRIAVASAATKADVEVRSAVVGLSGDVRLSTIKGAVDLGAGRCARKEDIERLRNGLQTESLAGRRVIHRFDGPFTIGDLFGIENPEGLNGDRLEMNAYFLSAPADRLDNLLAAVRAAGVEIEAVSLEPMSSSLGALSPDERNLGAAVLDLGAGSFRGALWDNGRLRQMHIVSGDRAVTQSGHAIVAGGTVSGGMEGVTVALARRFRIAPATAARVLRTHGALEAGMLAELPPFIDVMAVDGLGNVRIETRELALTLEELLAPMARALREGLPGLSVAHAGGIVLTGGGASLRGMTEWISKRFGHAPVRIGTPHWTLRGELAQPMELSAASACSLAGLIALGVEGRTRLRKRRGSALFARLGAQLRRLTAAL